MNTKFNLEKFYKGKKVLVTGHTGFKGAWLSKILVEFGADVSGFSLKPNTDPNLFSVLGLESELAHNIGDIRDIDTLDKVIKEFQPEIIFHLAAQPLVRDSYDDPIYTYGTNVMGTANVLECMRKNKTKVGVIITTDKVYKNFEKDVAYKEDDQLGGHDPYSNSKACADLVVSSYISSFFDPNDYGIKHSTMVASARAGNVIGGGDWAKDRLIPDAMKAFLLNDTDMTIRKPNAIRPWQHVFESLYGYLLLGKRLAEEDKSVVGAWNFGPFSQDMKDVKTVMELVTKCLGKGNVLVAEDHDKHEATNLQLDNTKANTKLGWQPRYNLEAAISETCTWYKEFYTGKTDMKEFSIGQIKSYFNEEV